MITTENRRKAMRRRDVLRLLYLQNEANPPGFCTDAQILEEFEVTHPEMGMTKIEVRKHLGYLEGHSLIQLEREGMDMNARWGAAITSQGVDYLEGIGETLEGVNRDA